MSHPLQPEVVLMGLAFVSVIYLVLIFFIMRGSRPTLERKLILAGLVTALVGAWFGALTGAGAGVHITGPMGGTTQSAVIGMAGDAGYVFMKIAVILIVAGVAVGICGPWLVVATPVNREIPPHAPPQ